MEAVIEGDRGDVDCIEAFASAAPFVVAAEELIEGREVGTVILVLGRRSEWIRPAIIRSLAIAHRGDERGWFLITTCPPFFGEHSREGFCGEIDKKFTVVRGVVRREGKDSNAGRRTPTITSKSFVKAYYFIKGTVRYVIETEQELKWTDKFK
jgi:hypothetical protein